MENTYISTQKFAKVSPRKARVVVESIKGLTPVRAVEVLPYVQKKSAGLIAKVIKSAIANASMQGAKAEELIFKEIQIAEGPRLKRGIAVSRGQYHPIKKRMSHIRIVLTVKKAVETKTEEVKEIEAKEISEVKKEMKTVTAKKKVGVKSAKKGASKK